MNIKEVMTLADARNRFAKKLSLHLNSTDCTVSSVAKLQDILHQYKGGTCPLHLLIEHPDAALEMEAGANWFVKLDDELLSQLNHILGDKRVNLSFN